MDICVTLEKTLQYHLAGNIDNSFEDTRDVKHVLRLLSLRDNEKRHLELDVVEVYRSIEGRNYVTEYAVSLRTVNLATLIVKQTRQRDTYTWVLDSMQMELPNSTEVLCRTVCGSECTLE